MNRSVARIITATVVIALTTIGGTTAAQAKQGADDAPAQVQVVSDDTAAHAADDSLAPAGSDDPAAHAADDSLTRAAGTHRARHARHARHTRHAEAQHAEVEHAAAHR